MNYSNQKLNGVTTVQFDIMLINVIFAMVSGAILIMYLRWNTIHYRKSSEVIFVILFGIISGIISTKSSNSGDIIGMIKPLFLLFAGIIIIKFLLDIKWIKSITLFCLFMICSGMGNAAGLLLIGLFFKGDITTISTNALFYICTNTIIAVLTVLFLFSIRPINSIIKQILHSKELAITFLMTFIIICANAGLYYYVKVFNFTAFLVIAILSLIYCTYIIFSGTTLYKRELEKAEQEQQGFYNKSLEGTLFNLRRFRHDWGNNLAVINTMLTMNKYEEAKAYLHEIIDYNTTSNNTLLYNIKNAGLFGIISSKQGLALDKGIDIDIKGMGEIRDIPGIKMSELCEVVGILLDNAIEESEKMKENIELNYMGSENAIEISVKNKCENDIDINKLGTESTKGAGRGTGLQIVDQIIGKYNHIHNYRSYEIDSKTFEQLLVIEKGL
jgi:two-component system sensor histidine kinase AgrC